MPLFDPSCWKDSVTGGRIVNNQDGFQDVAELHLGSLHSPIAASTGVWLLMNAFQKLCMRGMQGCKAAQPSARLLPAAAWGILAT
ncbi:hypothetical protein GX51_03607 [Blastomyces parvus]|uniref:Uncharacterized protein n=1 Tax=Blastomyces parvus TaxID=2060905 RepID=A0A2B7X685_9EURO|nr:hypothetical protein GX51_03607 [Blastomyces parvus]